MGAGALNREMVDVVLDVLGGGPFAVFVLVLVGVLGSFARNLWDWIKGRHDRERTQAKERRDLVATLKAEVREAEGEADRERSLSVHHMRRYHKVWEYALTLRQNCICKHGATPDDLPPWPEVEKPSSGE